jgi:hypothetical protein
MGPGRLIRVSKSGDKPAASYIVNETDQAAAIEIVRKAVCGPDDDIQDLGRVSEELLKASPWSRVNSCRSTVFSISANSSNNRSLNREMPSQRERTRGL